MKRKPELTEEQADEIYREWAATGSTLKTLALKYDILIATVSHLITAKLKKGRKRVLVDYKLEQCANIECNLGIDSTRRELLHAKWQQRKHLQVINKIDSNFFSIIKEEEL